jgi:hypothetical protein
MHTYTRTQVHTYTHKHTNTQTHKHTDTQTHKHATETDIDIHTHTETHTHKHTRLQTHKHTHKHTNTETATDIDTHTETHIPRYTQRDQQTHTHTHLPLTHIHTHKQMSFCSQRPSCCNTIGCQGRCHIAEVMKHYELCCILHVSTFVSFHLYALLFLSNTLLRRATKFACGIPHTPSCLCCSSCRFVIARCKQQSRHSSEMVCDCVYV